MVTTFFMVGFWFYKYYKNEDITLTEYVAFKSDVKAIYPELSICIAIPFLDSKFANVTSNLTKEIYLKYLQGELALEDNGLNVDYEQVTLNLLDFVNSMSIKTRSVNHDTVHRCSSVQNCTYIDFMNSFNGFMYVNEFLKCFSIDVIRKNHDDVVIVSVDFKHSLKNILNEVGNVFVYFNYPNQFLRDTWGPVELWNKKDSESDKKINFFKFESMEILQRRSKRNDQCVSDWMKYDNMVMKHHTSKIGCNTPYQNEDTKLPLCNAKSEFRESVIDMPKLASDFLLPCQELSQLSYKHTITNSYTGGNYAISIYFPNKKKVITQSQAIGIHALIGNIGGYIGLFLGKFIFSFNSNHKQKYLKNSPTLENN